MVFVPVPVQPPESPRVRELSRKIKETIDEFQQHYPMTPTEIRQALYHAAGSAGGRRRPLVIALVGGVMALGVALFVGSRPGQPTGGGSGLAVAVPVAVMLAALAVVVAIRLRD
jgi:hypothetical protein